MIRKKRERETWICLKIGVPLRTLTNKKIDSEIVREGNVKRTRKNKENEKDFEMIIYKHLKFM